MTKNLLLALFSKCYPMTLAQLFSRIGLPTLAMLLLTSVPALAVHPVATYQLDPTFSNSPQFHQKVHPWRVTSGPSGKTYVTFVNGGSLSGVNNQRRGAVIRFNADGTLDQSFNVGPQFTNAWAVIEQANGQVLVGGLNSNESDDSGLPLYRVFRLNANGTRDSSYQSPVFTGIPRYMTLQPDGKLLVTNPGGSANGGLANLQRLNSDGSLDTTFVSPALPVDSTFFTNIVVDATGKILVGGIFTTIAGQPRPGIARLLSDGTLDSTFVPSGFTFAGQMRGIAIQTQGANAGKIVIAGGPLRTSTGTQTTCPVGQTTNCALLRLNADGSLDTNFTLVTSSATGVISVRARLLSLLPDDKLLTVSTGVARFNADGSIDASYNKPVFSGETFWMDALADGRVYVPLSPGSSVNGIAAPQQIMRFNADGSADAAFAPGTFQSESYPNDLAFLPDGRFLTWGAFDTVGALARSGAARFNADGTLDTSYAITGIANLLGIYSAGVLSDGGLLAAITTGTDPSGVLSPVSSSIARFSASGAADSSYVPDPSVVSAQIGAGFGIRVLPDGKALVWAQTPQRVIDGSLFFKRLNPDGSLDNSFGGLSGTDALFGAVYRDATGAISSITAGGFNILGRYADGRLIAAATKGPYALNAATLDYTLLRLNADGTLDSTFSAPTRTWPTSQGFTGNPQVPLTAVFGSPFSGVSPQADGSVIVYGIFTTLGGQAAPGMARLTSSGALDAAFSVGTGAELRSRPGRSAQVMHITTDVDGKYWVSGLFDTFGGQAAPGLVRLNADGTVDGSFASPLAYRNYIGGNTRVVFDAAGRPMVLGTFLPSADGFPNAIHRLALNMPLGLTSAWNLVGNGFNSPLDVATAFGNTSVFTVWKWLAASGTVPGKWAFYTPSMADGGAAYAASKGYDFLTVINSGEGFWVNAKGPFSVQLSGGPVPTSAFADRPTGNALPAGWSLIAVGDNPTPRAFANGIALAQPAAGSVAATSSVTTLWAWDAVQSGWYFYAPGLDNDAGLARYIASKSYLDFGTANKTLSPNTGFWVNHP